MVNVNPIDYPRILFTETQRFRPKVLWIIGTLATLFPITLMFISLRFAGKTPAQMPRVALLCILISATIPITLMFFAFLTVTVKTDEIVLQFFFYRRRIPHAKVKAFEPLKYHWTDFGGWGLKWDGDKTWAYTMRGDRAVRLHLLTGKMVVVGSQRADELASALEEAGVERMPDRKFKPLV